MSTLPDIVTDPAAVFMLQADGIRLHGGHPSALLVSEEGACGEHLTVSGVPRERQMRCTTPLGDIVDETT